MPKVPADDGFAVTRVTVFLSPMHIWWIGFVVPDDFSVELAAHDKYITSQTQRFQSRVIKALELAGHRAQIVASPPVTDWSRIRLTGLKRWQHVPGSQDTVVPMVNLIGIKQIVVTTGCLVTLLVQAWRRRHAPSVILVGDSYVPHLLAARAAGFLLAMPVCSIITDMPNLIAVADPWYKRLLRPVDAWLVRTLLGRMEALVVLSKHIATDFFPTMRHLVMPGLIDDGVQPTLAPKPADARRRRASEPFVIMYAGALVEEYGIRLLLDAFARLRDEPFELWLTGRGDFEPAVIDGARRDPRISYLGFISRDELETRLARADALVSLRLTHAGHARYSFPSKLLEYMLHDAFVVTNRFPSLPDEYAEHLVLLESEDATSLAQVFRRLRECDVDERIRFTQRMRAFVRRSASITEEGRRLGAFLTGIVARPSETSH